MLSIFIFLILILILIFILGGFLKNTTLPERILAVFVLCAADVVIVMELAGLLGLFDKPLVLLLFQTFFTGSAAFAAWRAGIKPADLVDDLRHFLTHIKQLPSKFGVIAGISFVFIAINYIFLAYLSIKYPQNVSDPLYNHLSRIGFWIQQGSLAHYEGFSIFGMIYPYNSSLLMSPPILFLKTASFAGMVQFGAAIGCAVAIYLVALNLGFSRKGSLIAGLIFLTYPVILYESITAQNDLVAAFFNLCAFAFLILYIKKDRIVFLNLSVISMALAIGTNQSGLLVLPGYLLVVLYMGLRKKKEFWSAMRRTAVSLVVSFLILGSYSYIQNFIDYGNFVGPNNFLESVVGFSGSDAITDRLSVNSSRLFSQFISCDGLPTQFENSCYQAKSVILLPILNKEVQSPRYLYGNEQFVLAPPPVLNSEYVWFGLVSWIIILPALVWAIFDGIKNKAYLNLLILLAAVLFFFTIAVIKKGWDPYQGRYLITSIVLLQPLTARILAHKTKVGAAFVVILCLVSVGIMEYSLLSNANMPLASEARVKRILHWGNAKSELEAKIAAKVVPSIRYSDDIWGMSMDEIRTISGRKYLPAVVLVHKYVPSGSSLGIVANTNLFFDFLFRGDEVRNRLVPLYENTLSRADEEFVLAPSSLDVSGLKGYTIIGIDYPWQLLEANQ